MLITWLHRAGCLLLTQAPHQGWAITPTLNMTQERYKQVAELRRGCVRAPGSESRAGAWPPGCPQDRGLFMTACRRQPAGLETRRDRREGLCELRGVKERYPFISFQVLPVSASVLLLFLKGQEEKLFLPFQKQKKPRNWVAWVCTPAHKHTHRNTLIFPTLFHKDANSNIRNSNK